MSGDDASQIKGVKMKHSKYFKQLNELDPKKDIGYIKGKAKVNCKSELDSCKQLHNLLRDYTYHLIGLSNTFRDIARVFGKHTGDNWRIYSGMSTTRLQDIANQLNSISPYDVDSILKLEVELETIAESLKQAI